ILVLEILHQPRAVEFTGAQIACQCGEPTAAEQAAGIPHRILAAHARPVRKRRSGDDEGTEQFGADRRQHHHRPAGLAVPDYAGFPVGARVAGDDFLEERGFGSRDIFQSLAGHRLRKKSDEVTGVTGFKGNANLTVGFEAADPWTMTGTRVDNYEWPPL